MNAMPKWPKNADGDALRRIWNSKADFTKEHLVDFQIDFRQILPVDAVLELLRKRYGEVNVVPSCSTGRGYVEISKRMMLDYDEIVAMQQSLTDLTRPFGGWCECWGMLDG